MSLLSWTNSSCCCCCRPWYCWSCWYHPWYCWSCWCRCRNHCYCHCKCAYCQWGIHLHLQYMPSKEHTHIIIYAARTHAHTAQYMCTHACTKKSTQSWNPTMQIVTTTYLDVVTDFSFMRESFIVVRSKDNIIMWVHGRYQMQRKT